MTPIPINARKKSVDVPHSHHAFSQSPSNAHIVYGSVGRSAFADPLHLSPVLSAISQADEPSDYSPHHFAVNPRQAQRLAAEEEEILASNGIYKSAHDSTSTLTEPSQSSPLISQQGSAAPASASYGATNTPFSATTTPSDSEFEADTAQVAAVGKLWDEAVDEGRAETSYNMEIKFVLRNSGPLIITFLLQYSLTVASIFSVGHLGKSQLAAVSLASMTANITGFALIQGLATCLDTLCAQAYGAGNYALVGEYSQKCTLMIMAFFAPIGVLWLYAEPLINLVVTQDDPILAPLATSYLRIVLIGVPGYIVFECGKRFVQAQGIYFASTFVLFICAPINALLNYYLVWSPVIGLGFIGAPLAVAITQWLMAFLLILYVKYIDGLKCWDGISHNVFKNWGTMFRLAIPGVIMIEAEFFAFEILTFAASRLGTTALAAQSVIATTSSLLYQIPFAMSIVSSNRIANFVGASLPNNARIAKNVVLAAAVLVGLIDGIALYLLRYHIGTAFSADPDVIDLVAKTIVVLVWTTFVDAPGAVLGGVLRGFGRQSIGGYLNLFFYYALAMPLGIVLAFKFGLSLSGLWLGIFAALTLIDICELFYVQNVDWDAIIVEAEARQGLERIVA